MLEKYKSDNLKSYLKKRLNLTSLIIVIFINISSGVFLIFNIKTSKNLLSIITTSILMIISIMSYFIMIKNKRRIGGTLLVYTIQFLFMFHIYYSYVYQKEFILFFMVVSIIVFIVSYIIAGVYIGLFGNIISVIISNTALLILFIIMNIEPINYLINVSLFSSGIFIITINIMYNEIIKLITKERLKYKDSEKKLIQSENIYKAVVEDQTEMIFRYKPDGTIVFANGAFCNTFNTTPKEIIGQKFALDYVNEDKKEELENHKFSKDAPIYKSECHIRLPNRRLRWIRCTKRAIFDDKGDIVEIQAIAQDITENKLIEDVMKQSEAKFRGVFEYSPIGIVLIDATGNIVEMNQSCIDIWRFKDPEIIKRNFNMFEYYMVDNNIINNIKEGEVAEKVLVYDPNRSVERKRLPTYHTNIVYLHSSITPIISNDDISGYLVHFIDITERKKATIELNRLNIELENKVMERTKVLEKTNRILMKRERKLQNELDLGGKIQHHFILAEPPESTMFSFHSVYKPIERVGGDFYDYITGNKDDIGLIIADVSGHGVPAALITSMLKISCTLEKKYYKKPHVFLERLNKSLTNNILDNFVTAFYGVLTDSKQFIYSNAGHCTPIIYNKKEHKIIDLEPEGVFLGVFEKDINLKSRTIKLDSGDKILLYTDGLLDGLNLDNNISKEYINKMLLDNPHISIYEIVKKLNRIVSNNMEIDKNLVKDDITIVGVEVN